VSEGGGFYSDVLFESGERDKEGKRKSENSLALERGFALGNRRGKTFHSLRRGGVETAKNNPSLRKGGANLLPEEKLGWWDVCERRKKNHRALHTGGLLKRVRYGNGGAGVRCDKRSLETNPWYELKRVRGKKR